METEKRYNDFGEFLRKYFPYKVQKISINAGFTCPNRDGKSGYGGCTYCNNQTFSPEYCRTEKSITRQIEEGIEFFGRKYPDMRYLAYFQAYTNTYAPVSYLRKIFTEALMHPDIVALSIATRPDCLNDDVLELLDELNQIKPVWIELGLQTIHPETAAFIRRGYDYACFTDAVEKLHQLHIPVITHLILGLPGEDRTMILESVKSISGLPVSGVKLQLLHVLKGTDLADYYQHTGFPVFSMEEYVELVIDCLEYLSQDIVIHRLTGDGPKDLLIAPLWSTKKRCVLNTIHRRLKERDTFQGRLAENR